MNTVPDLPDELHELIAQYNKRSVPGVVVQWIKQGPIFQIVIYPVINSNGPMNFECIKNKLEERMKTTQRLSKSLPFSINRMNEAANNWQIRLEMNENTRLIGPIEFCAIAKEITESVAKKCNYTIGYDTERFMMQINTQVVTFTFESSMQGEVPCKAYRLR